MLITRNESLRGFKFWYGARDTAFFLSGPELDTIEAILCEQYFPDGIDETELNDFFWYERDRIAAYLGYSDWDELLQERQMFDENEEVIS